MIRKIVKLCLIIAWMGLIFSFSNDTGVTSTRKSDNVIIKAVQFFSIKDLTDSEIEIWTKYLVVPVRKGAHFVVYFALGGLVISFFKEFGQIDKKMVLLAIFVTFLYACSDEVHQLMIPGRSGQISDVMLDTISAFLGIMGYKLINNKIKGEKNYE